MIEPLFNTDDINHFCTFLVSQDSILHILVHCQRNQHFLACFLLPFTNSIQPELHEMKRSGKLLTDGMNDIRTIRKSIQCLQNILTVQFTSDGMCRIIEIFRHKDALVSSKRNRFRELRMIDIISTAPRTIYPVSASLQDVVLKIVLIDEHHSLFSAFLCQLLQPIEIPGVGSCQIIFTQSIPCCPFATTCKRLLIERSPHIAVTTLHPLMIITTAIIPQAIVL